MSTLENLQTHFLPELVPDDDDLMQLFRGPLSGKATVSAVRGGGTSLPISLSGGNTFTAAGATAGNYTVNNSAIVVKNDAGDEVYRVWGTDPDTNNYNSVNLYIGLQAGNTQPTDNTSAGYSNVGVGPFTLMAITEGANNAAFGPGALEKNTIGNQNTAAGFGALGSVTTGIHNVGIGGSTDVDANAQNSIVIGYNVTVTGNNKVVIGNSSITDAYFGSVTGAAKIHGKGDAIVFPDADPHVAGAAYWVAGVLTKSAG